MKNVTFKQARAAYEERVKDSYRATEPSSQLLGSVWHLADIAGPIAEVNAATGNLLTIHRLRNVEAPRRQRRRRS